MIVPFISYAVCHKTYPRAIENGHSSSGCGDSNRTNAISARFFPTREQADIFCGTSGPPINFFFANERPRPIFQPVHISVRVHANLTVSYNYAQVGEIF